MKNNKFLLKLDLQYHAGESDDVIVGGYVPEEMPTENPILSNEPDFGQEEPTFENQEMVEEPNLEGQQQEEQPLMFDFGGRQVNPNDPEALRGLHEDWTNTQRYIQQVQQQNQQLQAQMYQMAQMQQQMFQQPQQPQEETFDTDKFLEQFYENPQQALASVTQKYIQEAVQAVEQRYEPIVKEREYQQQINSVASQYHDFQQYVPQISQMVAQIGEQEANRIGLENLYFRAKAMSTPNPQQFLNDPSFITQHVMSNEQIKNQVFNELMRTRQQQQPKAPVMGSQFGGQASFAQTNSPKSIEEAGRLARQHFNQN